MERQREQGRQHTGTWHFELSNKQLQLMVWSLFELKYLLRYICFSHQGYLCSISLGCARHHERHRLDHPLDSRSENVSRYQVTEVTKKWHGVTWSERSSEYEYSSMSLVRKASLYALELELFWNSSIGKVNSGQNTNGILEIQVYRTAWCWPLAPLPWRITIPTVLVSLKWGPSMLFAKFTSASWSSFYDYFFYYIYIIIFI